MTERADLLDLSRPLRVHITNVGGAGMSAVAVVMAEMGHHVSGHDPAPDTPFLAHLRSLGVVVHTGDDRAPLSDDVEAVITSTATPDDDPDVVTAVRHGVPVMHRSAALAAISATRTTVAVAGTHGKTTTSALLATILTGAGLRPGYIVGAAIGQLGRNATWGSASDPLVVEADESDGTFLALDADAGIVTSVEADHLELWGGEEQLRDAFERFARGLVRTAVLCADDPGAARLVSIVADAVTYGRGDDVDYRIEGVTADGSGVRFHLHHADDAVDVVVPTAPGLYNALNATAAIAMAHQLGVPLDVAAVSLAQFGGVARRFEHRGEAAGVTFVDDYAHLPTEVAAALAAARSGPWARVVCCFQPHRYSRTAALWSGFVDAFVDADLLCVTDVYGAGEPVRPGVRGKLVVDAVLDAHPWASVAWLPTLDDVVSYLGTRLRPGDLCLTLGAGDLTTVPDRVLAALGDHG